MRNYFFNLFYFFDTSCLLEIIVLKMKAWKKFSK